MLDPRRRYTRRRFLGVTAAATAALLHRPAALAAGGLRARFAGEADVSAIGRGVTAYDLSTLRSWITPAHSFFVRSHFTIPAGPAKSLEVRGRVGKPGSFSVGDLAALGSSETVVTLECAGNSVAQAQGLVSTARWGGLPLRALFDRVAPVAREDYAVFIGADRPPQGIVGDPYTRSLSVKEALERGAWLAWRMNGEPLAPEHGGPLRLVVPGWYAMASVKWLAQIEVRAEPYGGPFQAMAYTNLVKGEDGEWLHEPVTRVGLKSVVAAAEPIAGGLRLRGAAWGGERPVARVAVTADFGATWRDATLEREHAPSAWRLWRYDWKGVGPGGYDIACRAFDDRGGEQPLRRDARLSQAAYAHNEVIGRRLEVSRL